MRSVRKMRGWCWVALFKNELLQRPDRNPSEFAWGYPLAKQWIISLFWYVRFTWIYIYIYHFLMIIFQYKKSIFSGARFPVASPTSSMDHPGCQGPTSCSQLQLLESGTVLSYGYWTFCLSYIFFQWVPTNVTFLHFFCWNFLTLC